MNDKTSHQRIELHKLFFLYLTLFLVLFSLGYKVGLRGFVVSEPVQWSDFLDYLPIIFFRSLFGATVAIIFVGYIRRKKDKK